MKITLKSIKHHARMSEETNAFEADLYVDGKKVGVAHNDGHGGESSIRITDRAARDAGLEREIYAWAKTLPKVTSRYGELEDSIGFYIDRIVAADLEAKAEAKLTRTITTRAEKFRAAGHFPWALRWYDAEGHTVKYIVAASRTADRVDVDVATTLAQHGQAPVAPTITKF